MSTSFTYSTLKTAIKNRAEDQGTEFDSNIDVIIYLGEDKVLKALPLTLFDARGDVSLTAGTANPTKPTGCILTHSLYYTSGGSRVILRPRRYDFLIAVVPNTTQAAPRWYADDYSETNYWIAPNPNVTLTAEALMTKRPTSIVSGATSWLGTNVGDLLLASCMVAAEQFILGWDEAKIWEAAFGKALADAQRDFAHLLRRPYMNP